jgi:hypothetical protein
MLTHDVLTWKRRALFFAWFPAFVCLGLRPATAKPVPAARRAIPHRRLVIIPAIVLPATRMSMVSQTLTRTGLDADPPPRGGKQ